MAAIASTTESGLQGAQPLAIHTLLDPACYQHPCQDISLLETHISWVILTGEYAYKIKKPVNFGFLDFSTLDKRHHYCLEELRLNQRLARDYYLQVVAITGPASSPKFSGTGKAMDYAVKMKQFPQHSLMSDLLTHDAISRDHLGSLAKLIAEFHSSLPVASEKDDYGEPQLIRQPVMENFKHIVPLLMDTTLKGRLGRLRDWCDTQFNCLTRQFRKRKQNGYVRECHGDLHTGNIVMLQDKFIVFDALEFNENLRWVDVMSEAALLLSDLEHAGRQDLAWRFLNDYLMSTGDYAGLQVFDYYRVYRAMVRAKVSQLRRSQPDTTQMERINLDEDFLKYVILAEQIARETQPILIITRGMSGSGKSYLSKGLCEILPAIQVRSDVERKRMFSMPPQTSSHSPVAGGFYSENLSMKVYQQMTEIAKLVLTAGYNVIIDATFLKREYRDLFHDLSESLGVKFAILEITASEILLRQRLLRRMQQGNDVSEAGVEVLEHQLSEYRPLDKDEISYRITIDTDNDPDAGSLFSLLGEHGLLQAQGNV